MDKSRGLRLSDVRAVFRLLGECRDLGDDSVAWRRHSIEGLSRLVGARMVAGGEVQWTRPRGRIEPLQAIETGFTPQEHQRVFAAYFREDGPNREPLVSPLQNLTSRLVTRTRRQIIDDKSWYSSVVFNEYHRAGGIDHCINSFYEIPTTGTINVISLHRPVGDRDFTSRERRLVSFFHAELGRLVGSTLVSVADVRDLARLAPRLRQTLECLLEGDGEKQVAARLGLSRPTVHQYVTMLYRHFGVGSRGELLASFLRRSRRG